MYLTHFFPFFAERMVLWHPGSMDGLSKTGTNQIRYWCWFSWSLVCMQEVSNPHIVLYLHLTDLCLLLESYPFTLRCFPDFSSQCQIDLKITFRLQNETVLHNIIGTTWSFMSKTSINHQSAKRKQQSNKSRWCCDLQPGWHPQINELL